MQDRKGPGDEERGDESFASVNCYKISLNNPNRRILIGREKLREGAKDKS